MTDFKLPPRDLPVGVYKARHGKYVACIHRWRGDGPKTQKHLGTFATVEEAAEARRKAEQAMKDEQ